MPSLVGSEMCIRDRFGNLLRAALAHAAVLHHALPVLFPERAFLLEVHLEVLEENSKKNGGGSERASERAKRN